MYSDDRFWVGGILFDFLTQPGDVIVDGACDREVVIPPNFIEQLLTGDGLAPVFNEISEDLELARR